jgi:hypothetical protein
MIMAIAVIQSISEVHERGGIVNVVVKYIVTEGDAEYGPAHFTVTTTPGVPLMTTIANETETRSLRDHGLTIDTWGDPVPLGRRIMFPDGTWAAL